MVLTGSGADNALGGPEGADEGRTAHVWVAAPHSGRAGLAERVVRDEYNLKQGHVMLDRIVVP